MGVRQAIGWWWSSLPPGFHILSANGLDPDEFLVLEVASWRSRARETLPGAIQIDPCYVEAGNNRREYYPRYRSADDARLLPLVERREALRQLGIRADSRVLVTGTGPNFPVNAARVAWALLGAGLPQLYWLDGGSSEWRGRLCAPATPRPAECFGQAEPWTQADRVPEPGDLIADIRTRAEFEGRQCHRYPFFESRGHLPGALWLRNWTHLVQPGTLRLKPPEQIAREWEQLGLHRAKPITFCCGTGWRSSLAACLALASGYSRVSNYDGGVYHWVSQGGWLEA